MIYRSNLTCPDLTPHFKHITSRVMGHSFGHDVLSDWADKADDDPVFGIYKQCGFWTHDEAAILYNIAKNQHCMHYWVDIGAHTGWTTAHIFAADQMVESVDPLLSNWHCHDRWYENLDGMTAREGADIYCSPMRSQDFFDNQEEDGELGFELIGAVCIDGDHEPGEPLRDAQNSVKWLRQKDGIIVFHDFIGQPVREAVTWLMDQGFHARVYLTPHMVACCWRGDFTPPDHVPDPFILSQDLPARCPDFDWSRVE